MIWRLLQQPVIHRHRRRLRRCARAQFGLGVLQALFYSPLRYAQIKRNLFQTQPVFDHPQRLNFGLRQIARRRLFIVQLLNKGEADLHFIRQELAIRTAKCPKDRCPPPLLSSTDTDIPYRSPKVWA